MPVLRRNILIVLSALYLIGLIIFTIYWGNNFSESVHKKGEEFNLFLLVMIISTYLLYLIAGWLVKRMKFILLIFLPLATVIGAFIIGLFLFVFLPLGGTPKNIMFIFFGCYAALNLCCLFLYQKKLHVLKEPE